MFDAATADLIRQAPAIRGVDPAFLPQDLTRAYAELVALRLREGDPGADAARELRHDRLLRMAAVYEALVDTAIDLGDRRGSAFVAGTAYRILGRIGIMEEVENEDLLSPTSIHPAAAHLFSSLSLARALTPAKQGAVYKGSAPTPCLSAPCWRPSRISRPKTSKRFGQSRAIAGLPANGHGRLQRPSRPSALRALLVGRGPNGSEPSRPARSLYALPAVRRSGEAFRRVEALATEDLQIPGSGGQLGIDICRSKTPRTSASSCSWPTCGHRAC